MLAALSLVLAVLCAPLALLAGARRPAVGAWVGAGAALATGACVAAAWAAGARWAVPWIPLWQAHLAFGVDGLSGVHGLLTTGVGAVVVAYAASDAPAHLEAHGRPSRAALRLHALLLAFLAAMVALVLAEDLLVLVVALDVTTLTSYLLIGFDRPAPAARRAALLALGVTGATSVVLLVGVLLLGLTFGTFSLPALRAHAVPGPALTAGLACVAVGALAKSAQVPLHFWLPRAMVAPTPVSAYLHAAALVAAGVYLLQRLAPLLERCPQVRDVLLGVGGLSVAVGSALALTERALKRVLAGSTIAQYGQVVVLVALGSPAAPLFVLAHGVCKAALFLAAGALKQGAGVEALGEARGLARRMPWLAGAAAVAAAGVAGLPGTVGHLKEAGFLAATAGAGTWGAGAGLLTASLTLTSMARFWWGAFGGRGGTSRAAAPAGLTGPVLVLAAAVLVGGVWTAPLAAAARAAGTAMLGRPAVLEVGYHLDARAENLLSLAAWALAALLFSTRRAWEGWLERGVAALARVGPARAYAGLVRAVDAASEWLHAVEVRDLRDFVAALLVPAGLLCVAAVLLGAEGRGVRVGPLGWGEAPLVGALAVAAGAALASVRTRSHLALVLTLSCVGFSLAAVFALEGAPDVALTAVLVETTFTLLFVAVLALLPGRLLAHAQAEATRPRRRDRAFATVAGASAALIAWVALSHLTPSRVDAAYVALAGRAHADDVVTAVLSDFRGLDTVGEASVLVVSMLGVVHLLREGR